MLDLGHAHFGPPDSTLNTKVPFQTPVTQLSVHSHTLSLILTYKSYETKNNYLHYTCTFTPSVKSITVLYCSSVFLHFSWIFYKKLFYTQMINRHVQNVIRTVHVINLYLAKCLSL